MTDTSSLAPASASDIAWNVRNGRGAVPPTCSNDTWPRSRPATARSTRSTSSPPTSPAQQAAAVDEAVAAGRDTGRLAGVPIALKDNMCTQGHPDDVFVEDPRRLEAAVRRDDRRSAARGRRRPDRQDEPRRVRDGLEHRELGVRPDAQPARPRRGCPVDRAADRPPRSPPGSRRSRSGPTPAARSANPRRCVAWSA